MSMNVFGGAKPSSVRLQRDAPSGCSDSIVKPSLPKCSRTMPFFLCRQILADELPRPKGLCSAGHQRQRRRLHPAPQHAAAHQPGIHYDARCIIG